MKARNNFSCDVTESDSFLEMSLEAQLSYFHLCANSDSDGHIRSVKRVARSYGFDMDDVQELYDAGLFLDVEGECYVTHHWQNNGKDSRWFEKTMERCVPYKFGLLRFAGDEGNSPYVLNIPDESTIERRSNDDSTTSDRGANDLALLGSSPLGSASASLGSGSSLALGWDGAEGKGASVHDGNVSSGSTTCPNCGSHMKYYNDLKRSWGSCEKCGKSWEFSSNRWTEVGQETA